jgi:dTDP-glucose 4,6-dehydratase
MAMTVLVTGGCGFIGSAFLNLMAPRHPDMHFVNLDALTYAAHPGNCAALEGTANYTFVGADITDMPAMRAVFAAHRPDRVFHFAAESHVDRSIHAPADFARVNVLGTLNLLECARAAWIDTRGRLFHHISTDEVFGTLGPDAPAFTEASPYDPRSPYSASKAGSDHLVRAYHHTYGLPVRITNCSNNFGPRQFPEKMIPLMILNAVEGKPLPVYGDGRHVRDWLHVDDHCEAIWLAAELGNDGETYLIGGHAERANIDVVRQICRMVAIETEQRAEDLERLITFVADRPGHDRRYAIDATRARALLGWAPRVPFELGLARTVHWYLSHRAWVDDVRTGAYARWLDVNYGARKAVAP